MKIETNYWHSDYKYEYPDGRPATPEEFKNLMLEVVNTEGNEETDHEDMDDIICQLLRDLGYGDGVDVFVRTPKWYS